MQIPTGIHYQIFLIILYRKMDESGVSVVIGFYNKKFTIKDIIELSY